DKLLGGLLSPAFDEPSCLSRYQSAQFWKSSNHTPSPYLLQKLRSYEAVHKRCGPHTVLYNKSIEQLRSNRSTGPLECNYVVWLQSGGLGNRLMSLISTFLYAILNNRVLLLSVPDDLHDMFCEPFPGTSWALPWDFPIKKLETHDFYRGSPQSYGNLLKNKVLSNGMNTTLASLPAYLYLHLMHDADDSDKMFYCEDAQPLFQSFPWLFLRSNQYFAPSLFLMSQYNDELQKLFPEKETVFHHLGRYLVHPTNSVWGYVTRYYEAYLANAKERVGIQVRNFPNAPVKLELMLDQVVNCTLKEKILPDIEVEVPANLTTSGVKPKAVLVTSLQTGYFEKLRNMYYEHSSTTGDAIGVYQPSHEELQRTENQNHNTKALAEMYLLSFSDVLVTTAFSTFGYMKQMGMQQQQQTPPLAGRRETKDEGSGGAHLVAGLGVVRPLVVLALFTLVLLLTLPSVAHRRHSLDLLLLHRPAASQGVSNHTSSAYLVDKLRRYEARHKKCGPDTELYKKAVEQLKSNRSTGPMECNYVVWMASDGLGNRILSISSAFLYALLNNKVLLLDLPGDMKGLFCEPFPNTTWVLPSDFPIKNLKWVWRFEKDPYRYGDMLKKKVLSNDMNPANASFPLPAYLYLHLVHSNDDFDKMFYCQESQLLLQKFPWLLLRSNQYFVPALFLIPEFKKELSLLFPERTTVFHHLGRYLFHPSNSVWGYVTRYYEAYLANAKESLGMQIRTFAKVNLDSHFSSIMGCALSEKLLPDVDPKDPALPTIFGVKPKAVLVTSLNSGYFEKLRDMYYEHATTTKEVIGIYQPSHEEQQHTEKLSHNMKALAEMYLLSLSDSLMTSPYSTFGYVAQGLGGLSPWILIRPDNKNLCLHSMTMEPCFHFPPSYDCNANKKVDIGSVVSYLRHCEDFRKGIKLFY
ncbi:unnamed protein product, partial [Musa banksii]